MTRDQKDLLRFSPSFMKCKSCDGDDIEIVLNAEGTTITIACLTCLKKMDTKVDAVIPFATYEELDAELKRRGM